MTDGDRVRSQYELLPYPPRDPADERRRLVRTSLDALVKINHHGFGGLRDFSRPFRVLVAGGGTGDSLIYLAEQLRHTPARLHYLDLSGASMEIARERARVRGLDNIDWTRASLLEVGRQLSGTFDYINCTGVLHHLDDPDAGLCALRDVLAPGGVMGVMVYARYGRTAIYQIQELMRRINGPDLAEDQAIANTRKVLESLPETNWLKRSPELHTDHERHGDAGLYDLFLHSTDRAYSVPELFQWLDDAGLELLDYADQSLAYEPRFYLRDPELTQRVDGLPRRERNAIAELLSGAITKHTFYCAPEVRDPPRFGPGQVPLLAAELDRDAMARALVAENDGGVHRLEKPGARINLPIRPLTRALMAHVDGRTPIREIVPAVASALDAPEAARPRVEQGIRELCDTLVAADMLYFCDAGVIDSLPAPDGRFA